MSARQPVPALRSQLPAVAVLTQLAYAELASAFPSPFWQRYSASVEQTILTESAGSEVWVLSNDAGTIQASVLFVHAGARIDKTDGTALVLNDPEMRLLAVGPAYRQQGLGERLTQHCLQRAHELGSARLTLHSIAPMQAAQRLYWRLGFERDAALDFCPHPDVHVLGYYKRTAANQAD